MTSMNSMSCSAVLGHFCGDCYQNRHWLLRRLLYSRFFWVISFKRVFHGNPPSR